MNLSGSWRVAALAVALLISMRARAGEIDGAKLGKMSPVLQQQLQQAAPTEKVSCIVVMSEEYPYTRMSALAPQDAIETFRALSAASQAGVLADLRQWGAAAEVKQSFWICNGFHLEATPAVIRWLSGRSDISVIDDNTLKIKLNQPRPSAQTGSAGERTVDWNVSRIWAPFCWSLGYNGQGVIVAETDTGVDTTHTILQGKYTGYWHDSVSGRPNPYDDVGHGTYCMGILLGANGIGVAPGAKFVAVKILGPNGGTPAWALDGMQWIANLKNTVDIKAMNASWSFEEPVYTYLWNVCLTFKIIDILPVFALGNNGHAVGSANSPANHPQVLGVGATDTGDNVADFSTRGPAPNLYPWNDPYYWYRPDWNLIKPDIVAPGVQIRSCWPGNQYQVLEGTSASAPHVTGSAAILCQKNPHLDPNALYNVLVRNTNAIPQGAPYPNNDYGWGLANVWYALQAIPSLTGDMNCDGVVDFDDINPFVQALSDPSGYQAAYPNCWLINGDCNGDGLVNFDDINAFVAILVGPP